MKKKIFATLIVLVILAGCIQYTSGWGVWGHNHINKGAVLALPHEMGMFFYNHADYITEESVMPDVRKHTMQDRAEGCRHYIDLEWYEGQGAYRVPNLSAAITKYGKDSLDKYGMLPWYIEEMMNRLTTAFKNKSKGEILILAADLGHYIGDAQMPLHTSINHNGQFTGQVGIHSFWEAELPELFGKDYKLYTGEAQYIDNIEKATWDMIDSSHKLVQQLLLTESKMRKDNPADKQYIMAANGEPQKNKYGQPVHTYEYAHVYHELLAGMVEKQLKLAIKHTSDFWYTAWVNAGKPDLSDMDPSYITDRNKPFYKEDIKAWKTTGKVRGFRVDKEY